MGKIIQIAPAPDDLGVIDEGEKVRVLALGLDTNGVVWLMILDGNGKIVPVRRPNVVTV